MCLWCSIAKYQKASSENRKFSSEVLKMRKAPFEEHWLCRYIHTASEKRCSVASGSSGGSFRPPCFTAFPEVRL